MLNWARFTAESDVFAWSLSTETPSSGILNDSEGTFSLARCSEPIDKTKTVGEDAGTLCLMIEPQGSMSSLVALVPAVSPPVVVRLFDVRQSRRIRDLTFSSPVRAVRLNMRRFIVMLEDQVQIFDSETLRSLHKFEAPRHGAADCCALSSNCILAIGAARSGSVLLFDALNLRVLQVLSAHQSSVSALALSDDGQILATASETGTLIRLFLVATGEKLCVFRRGALSCRVTCLTFSGTPTSTSPGSKRPAYLAVGSANGTVHIFSVPPILAPLEAVSTATSISNYFFNNVLPNSMTDLVEPTRCLCLARTKASPLACAFYSVSSATGESSLVLVRVVTEDGYFKEFTMKGESTAHELPLTRFSKLVLGTDLARLPTESMQEGETPDSRQRNTTHEEEETVRGGNDDDNDDENGIRSSPLMED